MEKEITTKRGLVLLLVVATVVIFIGMVWLIVSFEPWRLLNQPSSSSTVDISLVDKNCTYPVSFWREHPELYPPQIVIGNEIFQAKEIGTILADGSEDSIIRLKRQLVGAFLNIALGADESSIEGTIFQAYGWLVAHSSNNNITDEERMTGSQLYNALEAFNLGLTGVPACPGVLAIMLTNTPTPSLTLTLLFNITPSLTVTPSPSGTSTPTGLFTPGIGTGTPSPTSGFPGNPTLTATRYNSPTPTRTTSKTTVPASTWTKTATPVTPSRTPTPVTPSKTPTPITPTNTQAPSPTSTPEPPTPTYTQPPEPSPTFTEPPPPSPTITSPPPP